MKMVTFEHCTIATVSLIEFKYIFMNIHKPLSSRDFPIKSKGLEARSAHKWQNSIESTRIFLKDIEIYAVRWFNYQSHGIFCTSNQIHRDSL